MSIILYCSNPKDPTSPECSAHASPHTCTPVIASTYSVSLETTAEDSYGAHPEPVYSDPELDHDPQVDVADSLMSYSSHDVSEVDSQVANFDPVSDPGVPDGDPGVGLDSDLADSDSDFPCSDQSETEVSQLDVTMSEEIPPVADMEDLDLDSSMFEPIYENANITLCGAYCAIMELKRACRLSFTAISKILDLLQLLCPPNNNLPRSVQNFFSEASVSKTETPVLLLLQ